jgi:addiction module HigA family antidote
MYNPPHPGEILKNMWLEPLGLTITYVAEHLNVSRKTLSEIVNGHTSISATMAVKLEMAFGKTAASWMGHQAAHDLWAIQHASHITAVKPLTDSFAE